MNRNRIVGRWLSLTLSILGFALATGLSGCGGSNSNTAPPAVSANAPVDPASTAAGGSGMPMPAPPK